MIPSRSSDLAEISRACANLQERLRILSMPARTVQRGEWELLSADVRPLIPEWLISIHSEFALCGSELQTSQPDSGYTLQFEFSTPLDLKPYLSEDHYYRQLLMDGLFPLGSAENGNLWVLKDPETPKGSIYWFDLSSWDGSPAGYHNALTFAAPRLSVLLCCMEITLNCRKSGEEAMWVRPPTL